MRRIIGLQGYARVGKDEIGRMLVEHLGYKRFAKGDLIKEAAFRINPLIEVAPGQVTRLQRLVDEYGWEKAKDVAPEVRLFLQTLPDVVVDVIGFDAWNDAIYKAIRESGAERVVLTRICLPYEVEALHDNGGKFVRVIRPGFGPANDHPNEVALDDWEPDATIYNDGSLEDFTPAKIAAIEKALFD